MYSIKIQLVKAFNVLCVITLIIIFSTCNENNNLVNIPSNIGKTKGRTPTWFPNGKSIAFIGGLTDKEFGIYEIDVNGDEIRQIVVPEFAYFPDLSPDGKWIIYSKGGNIYKRNIGDDSLVVQLTFIGGNYFPSWSKDGQWIAFDSDADSPNGMHFVWKMRADGTERRRIIYSPELGEVRMPDWFPDGKRLAVCRYIGHGGGEIAIVDTLGNSLAILTNDDVQDINPHVSDDGLNIVFEKEENWGQIFRVKSDGTELTKISLGNSITPKWSPDGNWITYSSYDSNYIFVMDKNGISKRKL